MRLKDSIINEVNSIAPLRRAALSPSTFQYYELRTLEFVCFLEIDNPIPTTFVESDKSMCAFGIYLYDLNTRRGCLQHFRITIFGTIFFLTEFKPHLGHSRQLELGWNLSVPSRSPSLIPLKTVEALSA